MIAGLVCAADLATHNGAPADAARYLAAADKFKADLPKQTITTNGPLSKDPYFVRLTKDANANAGTTYNLGNSSVTMDQRAVTDAGFLDLVRLGIYRADDPVIKNSVRVTRQGHRVHHADRPVLAPVHEGRLRRAGRRFTVGLHVPGREPHDVRAAVAAARRRARRVRADARRPGVGRAAAA